MTAVVSTERNRPPKNRTRTSASSARFENLLRVNFTGNGTNDRISRVGTTIMEMSLLVCDSRNFYFNNISSRGLYIWKINQLLPAFSPHQADIEATQSHIYLKLLMCCKDEDGHQRLLGASIFLGITIELLQRKCFSTNFSIILSAVI